jgi:hypothetical protein
MASHPRVGEGLQEGQGHSLLSPPHRMTQRRQLLDLEVSGEFSQPDVTVAPRYAADARLIAISFIYASLSLAAVLTLAAVSICLCPPKINKLVLISIRTTLKTLSAQQSNPPREP